MLEKQQARPAARWGLFAGAFALALALDLWTKQWAWDTLRPGGPIPLWDPHLALEFAYNRGSAFGVIKRVDSPWLVAAITVGLAVWVLYTVRTQAGRVAQLGAGLVVGGALGNLYDRIFRVDAAGNHGVVDWIRVNFPWGGSWPNFNVADAALVIGVGLLLVGLRDPAKTPAPPSAQA